MSEEVTIFPGSWGRLLVGAAYSPKEKMSGQVPALANSPGMDLIRFLVGWAGVLASP